MRFIDLRSQQERLLDKIQAKIARVLDHGTYILGPEVEELEQSLARFSGAGHCVTCANGTDALVLGLMSEGIGAGDAVFVPAFTFAATAEAVRLTGAMPVFCDVEADTFNLDARSLAEAIDNTRGHLKARAVIAVDIFGLPANYLRINAVAKSAGLVVIDDAAQSFGAQWHGAHVGRLAQITTTSFFPAKPLGCYGDGGALFTDEPDRSALLQSLRMHGRGSDKYDNVRVGLNSRLDTIQAAILLAKMEVFGSEIVARSTIADRYRTNLKGVGVQTVPEGARSVWAQFTILSKDRKALSAKLAAYGIPTNIYYPTPLSRQAGYRDCPSAPRGVPVSEQLCDEVLSIPMHPYLSEYDQGRVIDAVNLASRG